MCGWLELQALFGLGLPACLGTKLLLLMMKFTASCFQSLLLLNYLVKNGSERVVTSAREHLYDLRQLENYTFTDEYGKDEGINGE